MKRGLCNCKKLIASTWNDRFMHGSSNIIWSLTTQWSNGQVPAVQNISENIILYNFLSETPRVSRVIAAEEMFVEFNQVRSMRLTFSLTSPPRCFVVTLGWIFYSSTLLDFILVDGSLCFPRSAAYALFRSWQIIFRPEVRKSVQGKRKSQTFSWCRGVKQNAFLLCHVKI